MLDRQNQDEAAVIEKMHGFNREYSGCSWSYALRDPKTGELAYVEMANRPCWGEMRAYGKYSTRPEDYKPGDLPRPMPAFSKKPWFREAVGLHLQPDCPALEEYVLGPESPWRTGLPSDSQGFHVTRDADGKMKGLVLTETDVDPTVMVSLFMFLRNLTYCQNGPFHKTFTETLEAGYSPDVALLTATYTQRSLKPFGTNDPGFNVAFGFGYFLPQKMDVRRFVNGDPHDLSHGGKWRTGEDYNRPELQDLFANFDLPNTTSSELAIFLSLTNVWTYQKMDRLKEVQDYFAEKVRSVLAEEPEKEVQSAA